MAPDFSHFIRSSSFLEFWQISFILLRVLSIICKFFFSCQPLSHKRKLENKKKYFFQAGTVTNPAIWLVLSAVRIFLSPTSSSIFKTSVTVFHDGPPSRQITYICKTYHLSSGKSEHSDWFFFAWDLVVYFWPSKESGQINS